MIDESLLKVARYDSFPKECFSKEKANLIEKFFYKLADVEFLQEVVSSSVDSGFLKLPSLISNECESVCVGSFLINYQNYLILRDIDGSIFVCGQRHLFVSDVFFPDERVVLKVDYAPFQDEVAKRLPSILTEKRMCMDPVSFKGAYVSYSRPYHYFYDLLPAFKYWINIFNLRCIDNLPLVEVESSSFLNSELIFSSPHKLSFDSEEAVNEHLGNKGFLLKMGYPIMFGQNEKLDLINDLDSHLRSLVKIKTESGAIAMAEIGKPLLGDVTIWVGLCNEKRRWIEQDEGIPLIIKKAVDAYDSVTVIFDGMTRPYKASIEEFNRNGHVQKELKAVKSMVERLSEESKVSFVNLVGVDALTKIAYSLNVDFFVSNFLTDSMYPARFGKAPGIGHGSFKAKHTEHLHPNTIIIKSKKSDDAKIVNKSSNWARQSYSIDPERIIIELKSIM